ncbi:aminotransferase class IV [Siphonobacter sp.]|uniref:aminotransferase class IV n=1 Tax=Siphonobacter sp. TaxID=1869184 RepID=UPI003B3B22C3
MQLLETIRVAEGELENLFYHQQRVYKSRKDLFGATDRWDLEEMIPIPDTLDAKTIYRCRVLYGAEAIEQVEFIPYTIRAIQSFQLMEASDLTYAYKFADRTDLESLTKAASADEILIVRNGLLTDTSYANIALFDGQEWYTPHQPLLEGTRRAALLASGQLIPERLSVDDLRYFKEIRWFNAMIPWKLAPSLPVSAIR